jgi:hypothetical protein
LSSYNPNPSVLLHAELNLALFKKRHGIRSGDIGISKDCCAACFTGLNALYESDYKYRVKGTHDKIYLSRLTGEDVMDKAIYDFISWSFRCWLKSIHSKNESEPSNSLNHGPLTADDIAEIARDNSDLEDDIFKGL